VEDDDSERMMEIKDRDGAQAVLDMFRALRRTVRDAGMRRRPQTDILDLWADVEDVVPTEGVKQLASLALQTEFPDTIGDMLAHTLSARGEYEWLLANTTHYADEIGWMFLENDPSVFQLILICCRARSSGLIGEAERLLCERLGTCSADDVWKIFVDCPDRDVRSRIAYELLQHAQPFDVLACVFARAPSEFCRQLAWEQIADWSRGVAESAGARLMTAKALLHRMRGAYPAYAERIAALQDELGFLA
jgi:hypothetical protein